MSVTAESVSRMPSTFVYVRTKAQLYCKIGLNKYLKAGRVIQMKSADEISDVNAVGRGMQQIAAERGWSMNLPLENIGASAFYDLCNLLHFKVIGNAAVPSASNEFLDEMCLEHIMTGDKLTLYNKVRIADTES